jgi:hypothetical protein
MTTAGVLLLATLAVAGMWIPVTWWRALAMVGAALLVCLMVLFFGPTKLIPMASGVVPATRAGELEVATVGDVVQLVAKVPVVSRDDHVARKGHRGKRHQHVRCAEAPRDHVPREIRAGGSTRRAT